VKWLLEVFVRSFSPYMDVALAREMSLHTACDPDMATRASELFSPKFKGRILPQEDFTALEKVSQIAHKTNEQLKVYDVSSMTDKIRAMKRGIRKTPAAVINGEKYEGLEEILQAISNKYSS